MKNFRNYIVVSMGIVLNVLGALIAMSFSIPIYMDSIGTIFVAALLGPKYAMLTGVLGSITSGMVFDVYSFYYAPTQLLTGFFSGVYFHHPLFKNKNSIIGSIWVGLPTALTSALITAGLFNGLTSSSSSALSILFNKAGLSLVLSILLVQILTDCADKGIAIMISKLVLEKGHIKEKWGKKWKDTVKSQIK